MRICVKVSGMMTGTEEVLRKALLNQKRWEDRRIKKERKTGIDFSQEFFHKVISYYVYPGWGQYNPKCPYKREIVELGSKREVARTEAEVREERRLSNADF